MADGDGGGGEGGGSAEWQPIYDRVQAQAEALAADRALLEAASKVQRESWEAARRLQRSVEELQAAAREKDAENGRLREEAADASKKLVEVRQANASRKMRWEAAYVELLLGANQKLAELRDGDMEDSRTRAEDPNSMEAQVCTRLTQNTADQARVASDLSTELKKLKQAYETLSCKKDQEVSALLSEKELVCNQLGVMQQDYDALLRNKKGEAAQAIEAAQKLQRSLDGLKVLAKKKGDEIGRLRAEAVAAEKKLQTAQRLQQSVADLKVLAQKKDDEIDRLQAEAVAAEKKLQKMHSLVKERDDEIQRLKSQHHESIQKRNKDIGKTHRKCRSDDPAVTARGNPENNSLRQMVEEDYISDAETVEKDEQDETSQRRISNDDAQSGSDADDDKQNGSDEDGDEQSGSDEDGDKQSGSDENGNQQSRSEEEEEDDDDDDDGQSKSNEHDEDEEEDDQSGRDVETTNNAVQKPLVNLKRKRDVCNAQVANSKSHMESNGVTERSLSYEPPEPLHCRKLVTTQDRRCVLSSASWAQYVSDVKDSLADQPVKLKLFLWFLCNFKNWTIDFAASSIKAVLVGHPKLIHRFNEFFPNNHQIEDNTSWSSRVAKRRLLYDPRPRPLHIRKLVVPHSGSSIGRVYMTSGSWAQYASDVKDSFADQPERHDYFLRCLSKCNGWSIGSVASEKYVAREMKYVLRGYPELIRGFNRFLPLHCEIEVEEDEEKQHPKWQPWNYQRRGQGQPMSKGAQHQPVMKLKEKEQQPKREPV